MVFDWLSGFPSLGCLDTKYKLLNRTLVPAFVSFTIKSLCRLEWGWCYMYWFLRLIVGGVFFLRVSRQWVLISKVERFAPAFPFSGYLWHGVKVLQLDVRSRVLPASSVNCRGLCFGWHEVWCFFLKIYCRVGCFPSFWVSKIWVYWVQAFKSNSPSQEYVQRSASVGIGLVFHVVF